MLSMIKDYALSLETPFILVLTVNLTYIAKMVAAYIY